MSLRRNRDFVRLWSGQAVSAVGTSVASIAYPLLALTVTGSAGRAGIVGAAGAAAVVIASPPAGVIADRWPIRRLLVGGQLIQAAVTVSVAVAATVGRVTFVHLVVAAVVTSACGPVFFAAESIAVRHVVPPPQLAAALAQGDARGHLAQLTGAPVGGFLFGVAAAWPVVADAVSFLACAGLMASVRGPLPGHRPPPDRQSMAVQVSAGLRHIGRSPFLRTTLLCSAGINIAFAGLALAVIASRRGSGAGHLGVALGLGAVGGLLGAWSSARVLRWLSPPRVIISFGWLAAATFALLGAVHGAYATGLLLAVLYFVTAPANAVLLAAQITATPPEMQGRVISAAVALLGITTPLGPLLAGALIDRCGPAATFLTFAAIITTSTVVMQSSRDVRDLPRLPG